MVERGELEWGWDEASGGPVFWSPDEEAPPHAPEPAHAAPRPRRSRFRNSAVVVLAALVTPLVVAMAASEVSEGHRTPISQGDHDGNQQPTVPAAKQSQVALQRTAFVRPSSAVPASGRGPVLPSSTPTPAPAKASPPPAPTASPSLTPAAAPTVSVAAAPSAAPTTAPTPPVEVTPSPSVPATTTPEPKPTGRHRKRPATHRVDEACDPISPKDLLHHKFGAWAGVVPPSEKTERYRLFDGAGRTLSAFNVVAVS
jgi:hypothetical protein